MLGTSSDAFDYANGAYAYTGGYGTELLLAYASLAVLFNTPAAPSFRISDPAAQVAAPNTRVRM